MTDTTTPTVDAVIETKKRAKRLDVTEFVKTWQKSKTLEDFCTATGLAATTATQRASSMRGKFRAATIKHNADGTVLLVKNDKTGEMEPDKGNGVLKKLVAAKEEIDFAALAIDGMDWLTEESDDSEVLLETSEASDGEVEVVETAEVVEEDDSAGWGDDGS